MPLTLDGAWMEQGSSTKKRYYLDSIGFYDEEGPVEGEERYAESFDSCNIVSESAGPLTTAGSSKGQVVFNISIVLKFASIVSLCSRVMELVIVLIGIR